MKLAIRNFAILGTAAISILFFQNCSDVGFTVSDPKMSKLGAAGLVDRDNDGIDDRYDDDGGNGTGCCGTGGGPNGGTGGNAGDGGYTNPTTYPDDVLRKACADLRINQASLVPIGDGGRVVDMSGNMSLKALGSLTTFLRVSGNVKILGVTGTGSIGSVDNTSGNILICGLSVGSIVNGTNGNVTIVGGNVGDINTFHGNLRIIDGAIMGSIQNSNGNIRGQ